MTPLRFALPARILHWLMAVLILAMLLIGAGMVSTTSSRYPELLAWHRPIGIAILLLALVRLTVRLTRRPPPLPADLPAIQVAAAKGSHYLLYALMIGMPLIGWAMQSAGGYPVTLPRPDPAGWRLRKHGGLDVTPIVGGYPRTTKRNTAANRAYEPDRTGELTMQFHGPGRPKLS
jgi:hypothetical protein